MNQSRWFGVAALVLTLAACGGGSEGVADVPPEGLAKLSQAAAAPSRVPESKLLKAPHSAPVLSQPVRVAAAAAAAATSGADAFFDWAERTQFDLFPGPQISQSLPPYLYRYYPTNQLYLAVSGDQIYALGPITNNQVVTLGKLSDYACFVSLASCAPPPVPTPSATLNAPNSGKAPWKLATLITVALKDSAGNLVSAALSCASVNAVALTVAADCSSVTGHRLGLQTITVSGGGVVANTSVKVIPQAQPLGTQGATSYFNLVVTPAGRVLAWGSNDSGSLAQGKSASDLASLSLPTPVKDETGLGELSGIVAVSTVARAGLALSEGGEVWSWGYGAQGRPTPNGDNLLPGKVRNAANNGSLSGIVAITGGDSNAVALADDGTVYSWGGYSGQEGGSSSKSVPGQVRGVGGVGVLNNVVAVSAGWNWSAALTADGKVVTWGFNSDARTGQGVTTGTVDVPGYVLRESDGAAISDIVAISAGYNFGLGLTSAGQVYGWGSNSYGQLGQNTSSNVHTRAVLVKGVDGGGQLGRIKMVAAGGNHTLALDQDGKAYSWGYAVNGQLGDGPNRPTGNEWRLPRAVVSELGTGQLANIESIAAGYEFSMALATDGSLLIWGDGYANKLGQGGTSTTDLTVPTTVKDTAGTGTLSLAPISVWPNLTRRGR